MGKRQRAMRRLLIRYKLAGKIDRKMYHRYYLKAKGNSFKNKANLIERINDELSEKKRKFLDNQLKLAEQAEQLRIQQESAKNKGRGKDDEDKKPKRRRRAKKSSSEQHKKQQSNAQKQAQKEKDDKTDKNKPKRKRNRKRGN